MFCGNCGSNLGTGSQICPECGMQIRGIRYSSELKEKDERITDNTSDMEKRLSVVAEMDCEMEALKNQKEKLMYEIIEEDKKMIYLEGRRYKGWTSRGFWKIESEADGNIGNHFCSFCGAKITGAYCGNCGRKVNYNY